MGEAALAMTTSVLTTSFDDLVSGMIARLVTEGYPYDPLTTTLEKYLATALGGITGAGLDLYLTHGGPRLLAELINALGGNGDALTTSSLELSAILAATPAGGGQ